MQYIKLTERLTFSTLFPFDQRWIVNMLS